MKGHLGDQEPATTFKSVLHICLSFFSCFQITVILRPGLF